MRCTRMSQPMVGHSMLLLYYGYKKRVKSNVVNSSFNHEITKLSTEFTRNIQKYELLLNMNGWPNETSNRGMYLTNIMYKKSLGIISQVASLETYDVVRGSSWKKRTQDSTSLNGSPPPLLLQPLPTDPHRHWGELNPPPPT